MTVYAESSAVLAWLLHEAAGAAVAEVLAQAKAVGASALTLAECQRAMVRAQMLGLIANAPLALARQDLARESAGWQVLAVSAEVLGRLSEPFPHEPIRSLDAIHLASALALREQEPGLHVLSLDERVRRSAAGMGFALQPR